jgi:hypothetical protein
MVSLNFSGGITPRIGFRGATSHGSSDYEVDYLILIPLELGAPIQSKISGRRVSRSPA